MATGLGGPRSGNGPPHPSSSGSTVEKKIDGSHTCATLPSFMDPHGVHGQLEILRIQGVDKAPLPDAPFLIRKSIQAFLGSPIEGAYPEANGVTYALKVRNQRQFNQLLKMTQLVDGTPVEVVEHPVKNVTKCVVSCKNVVNVTETELLEELSEQGVKAVHRITRREGSDRVNTPTLIVTIRGTNKPNFLDFGYIRCKTRPYYPSPMMCFNCWAFGHTRLRCKSNAVCGKCSGNHPILENENCTNNKFCARCDTNQHSISDRSCPGYQKENQIQRIKTDQDVSYPVARRIYDNATNQRSYASVTGSDRDREIEALHKKIDELIQAVNEKDQRISQLEATHQGQTNVLSSQESTAPPAVSSELKNMLNAQEEKFRRMIKGLMETNLQLQREVKELRAAVHPAVSATVVSLSEEVNIPDEMPAEKTDDEQKKGNELQPVIDPLMITPETSICVQDLTSDSSESPPSPDNSPNPRKLNITPRPTRFSQASKPEPTKSDYPSATKTAGQTPKRNAKDMSSSDQLTKQHPKKQREGAYTGTTQKLRR